jgi:hypothetical protein
MTGLEPGTLDGSVHDAGEGGNFDYYSFLRGLTLPRMGFAPLACLGCFFLFVSVDRERNTSPVGSRREIDPAREKMVLDIFETATCVASPSTLQHLPALSDPGDMSDVLTQASDGHPRSYFLRVVPSTVTCTAP